MGGDGGVIATNRRYMRGAGTADHTGDNNNNNNNKSSAAFHNALEIMTTCALSKRKLHPTDSIVVCRLGRLYLKEAIVQALLRRRQAATTSNNNNATRHQTAELVEELPWHIRKLSDLMPLRGQFEQNNNKTTTTATATSSSAATTATAASSFTLQCPITGKVLNGSLPAVLLVPGKPDTPNVFSLAALKHFTEQELQQEYGPIERRIRLAPTLEVLATIQQELEQEQPSKKKSKKEKKKRSKESNTSTSNGHDDGTTTVATTEWNNCTDEKVSKKPKHDSQTSGKVILPNLAKGASVGEAVRSRVESAIQDNHVLSSLFVNTGNTNDKHQTQKSIKQHKDDLFAR